MKQGTRRALLLTAAIVAVLTVAFAGLAGGKVKNKTFSSGDIDKPIADGPFMKGAPPAETDYEFGLNRKSFKRSKVKDVNVAVRITHQDAEDLSLSLSHRGTSVDLSTKLGETTDSPENEAYGSGAESCNGIFTVFNDEAETAIEDAEMPFAGQFVPENRLSEFDGKRLKGGWTLTVEDYAGIWTGELNCAELEIKYKKKKKH